jgi:hypothetical protein
MIGCDPVRFFIVVVVSMTMAVAMSMPVTMIVVPAKKPRAGHVDRESKNGGMDRDRFEEATDGFIADQERDHRQDDGAGESGQVTELAGPERDSRIIRVSAGVGICECREQQSTCMRAHMKSVGNERD